MSKVNFITEQDFAEAAVDVFKSFSDIGFTFRPIYLERTEIWDNPVLGVFLPPSLMKIHVTFEKGFDEMICDSLKTRFENNVSIQKRPNGLTLIFTREQNKE